MKILQISNYLYPHIGGIEQVAKDIANVLSENNDIEQKIICFNEDAADGEYICKRKMTVNDTVDGIDVIRCGCFAKVASQSLSYTYPYQLFNVIRNFKPDIIILHSPNPFVTTFLLPMLPKNTKLIVYWHLDITKQKKLEKLFYHQNLKLLKRADKIVATSPDYIDGSPYLTKFKNKCTVIPNCIRPERLVITPQITQKINQIKEQYKGKTICFTVGRHVPYKGITYLIKAGKYLDDNYVILIAGKGELTESLKSEASNDKKIIFTGRLSDEDLTAYYAACDIFCFPSITKNEAFGLVLAEAMYFSKPSVTFKINGSGVNYVSINGETGIECPNADSKAFAEAIKTITQTPSLTEKYGLNAKNRVENNFLFKQFTKNIELLINEIMELIK